MRCLKRAAIDGEWAGEGREGGLVVLLLAERARSEEGAHPTRAIEDQPGHPPQGNERAWRDHLDKGRLMRAVKGSLGRYL